MEEPLHFTGQNILVAGMFTMVAERMEECLPFHRVDPDAVCESIEARPREGPGQAFATLRERYPQGVSGYTPRQPRPQTESEKA